ncbi:Phosphatidyl-N-methylethanolamine N-methyltransferase [Exophiala dermatitidis]|uniref:Phosphatidyl-N-methylethanolamine N-methyltransferase n=2 Tax=Exophiala dermatitidis TaxID=5970 RepID=H6BX94_EXODN|nr:methylene-fatty-acyl-phospholipid synthase [Exophiala dermatitidis NIH/UT8656]KAJ4503900.1 Phosphatidyl-N-methylethanolamine N-methyltransferase [Exophiala dermatitidis]EHY56196.1 methylene-fatty-acyl-phospholipid synthase [Exophiala dermatitidis NIH/UT8656]KAJ4505253.1 Phosphatidyl-N-methylethanolamine N-methyltransferase [Exophiala dermatitidis]KAJ4505712.1 Phosphatidyl-N-methylethanolamine N-methyltransferase [Exophiala dermatitidis]KAJ4538707.1 Phosphatidyl-N-methylethanolamine N-methyl
MEKLQNLVASATGSEKVGFIDTSAQSLYVAAAAIAFNPIFWNVVARLEYNTHFLTKIFRSPYYGCYALAVTIFSLGILRDSLYKSALDEQPLYSPLHQPVLGAVLFAIGNVLVLSSMWALGVTGTYLGDYFGILMDHKVEGFPFNVTGAPMYWGSTLSFLGTALYTGRAAGVLLTLEVFVMYWIALKFEDPFTAQIYAKKESKEQKKA